MAMLTRRQCVVGIACAVLHRRRVSASSKPDALSALMMRSCCCVVGRSVAGESSWSVLGGARRIVTIHRVQVDEMLATEAAAGDELLVRTLGGRVGDVAQRVFGEAELSIDRPALLFLARLDPTTHAVTDLGRGCFPLERDAQGVARVSTDCGHARDVTVGANQLLAGASLLEVRQLLQERGLLAR
jgi:hypothetical protein